MVLPVVRPFDNCFSVTGLGVDLAMVSGATLDVMRRRSSSRRKRESGTWRDTESLDLAAWDAVLQLRSTVCEGTRDIVQTTRINRL